MAILEVSITFLTELSCSHRNDFTATVPVPKSSENHIVKNQLFMCLPPAAAACFETGFGFVLGFEEG